MILFFASDLLVRWFFFIGEFGVMMATADTYDNEALQHLKADLEIILSFAMEKEQLSRQQKLPSTPPLRRPTTAPTGKRSKQRGETERACAVRVLTPLPPHIFWGGV